MANNPTPVSYDPLVQLLEDAADGAHTHGAAIGLASVVVDTIVTLTVTARNSAGESPAGNPVDIAVP